MKPSPDPRCPDEVAHTPAPTGYIAFGEWAEQMLLTHRPKRCPGCGLATIWETKPGLTHRSRPAQATGDCSRCGAWYDLGVPIRTDGRGGWIASCCPEVADA